MDRNHIKQLLINYDALVGKVDHFITHITKVFPDQIACKKGCDACCKFLTLFPVEAMALSDAFADLPEDIKIKVIRKAERQKNTCPLLIDKKCVLYPARPIICRTHGYPIYMEKNGKGLVDFCPENFKAVTSFKKELLLDIEQLNTLLSAINRRFMESIETDPPFLDRIPISKAIFLLSC